MKRFVLFLGVLFILAPGAHGQGVALAAMADGPRLTTQSFVDYMPEKEHTGLGTTTKTGLICMGGGVLLMGAGYGLAFDGFNNSNGSALIGGFAIVTIGSIAELAGIGMAIGGGIHDISRHHRYKHNISLIAPRKNQVGIAYNF